MSGGFKLDLWIIREEIMKFIKWRCIITCVICLLPILFGVLLWESLPEKMAIHFNVNNEPDNFASKGFTVFGLPLIMAGLQMFTCIINNANALKYGKRIKFERVAIWIIPVMAVAVQGLILAYGLGKDMDIRKIVTSLVGVIFLVVGKCLLKTDYVRNANVSAEDARKINRFAGYGMMIMGMLGIVSVFFSPIASVIWLILLIPYTISTVIYGIIVGRK